MESICPVIGFFLWFGFVGFIIYSGHRNTVKKLESIAKRVGLQVIPGGFLQSPIITGVYKGFPCEINSERDGGRGISINMTLPVSENFYFHIYPRGIFTIITRTLSRNDIRTGYKDFDDAFVIEGDNTDRIRDILPEDLRRAMLFNKNNTNISFYGNKLRCNVDLSVTNENILFDMTDILYKIACSICGNELVDTRDTEDDIYSRQLTCQDFKICLSCRQKLYPPYSKFCIHCGEKV